jgi:hypothetical protein
MVHPLTCIRRNPSNVHGNSLERDYAKVHVARRVPAQVGLTPLSASRHIYMYSSHGMDVILRDGVIEYRAIGGTLDFCESH